MDLEQALLKEYSKPQILSIVDNIGTDSSRFAQLMDLFLNGDALIRQRSAWAIHHAYEAHPELFEPYLEALVMNLRKEGQHDAEKRSVLRLFQFAKIPEELYGHLADLCFGFLASFDETVAVKVFSMTILERICRDIPELKNELRILIEDQLPVGSPGFRNRGLKILKLLK